MIFSHLLNMQSHPSWVCGLKPMAASLPMAWRSHTLRGCVDWNSKLGYDVQGKDSHTLRGCVDWNSKLGYDVQGKDSHTLRGCVDWNRSWYMANSRISVTPFVGVWIETSLLWISRTTVASHPSWVCGLKLYFLCKLFGGIKSHTLRGCVDWNRRYPLL